MRFKSIRLPALLRAPAGPASLPAPPRDRSRIALAGALVAARELSPAAACHVWRIGGLPPGAVGHPLTFVATAGAPKWRFDDPDGEFRTWYGAMSSVGAFWEVYGGPPTIVSPARRTGRVCGLVELAVDLELVDLRSPKVMALFPGLDDRIGTTEVYSVTQAWARALWERGANGVVYHARKAGLEGPSVAVFLPRSERAISPAEPGEPLDSPRFDPERKALASVEIHFGT